MAQYAYVTYIMRGDRYAPGAYALANSIIATGSKYDRICLVTEDVSVEARTMLGKVFTTVLEITYIKHKRAPLKGKKQEYMYSAWMDVAFTKFHIVDPSKLPYKKVLFLDADMVLVENCDSLFELAAPAGIFHTALEAEQHALLTGDKSVPQAPTREKPLELAGGAILNPYRETGKRGAAPMHGRMIMYDDMISAMKHGGFVACGGPLLLEPSLEAWNSIPKILTNPEPYGHVNCISGIDEQFVTELYPCNWTNIHPRYSAIIARPSSVAGMMPAILHYFTLKKPWEIQADSYTDLAFWWGAFGMRRSAGCVNCSDSMVLFDAEMFRRWFVCQYHDFAKYGTMPSADFVKEGQTPAPKWLVP